MSPQCHSRLYPGHWMTFENTRISISIDFNFHLLAVIRGYPYLTSLAVLLLVLFCHPCSFGPSSESHHTHGCDGDNNSDDHHHIPTWYWQQALVMPYWLLNQFLMLGSWVVGADCGYFSRSWISICLHLVSTWYQHRDLYDSVISWLPRHGFPREHGCRLCVKLM